MNSVMRYQSPPLVLPAQKTSTILDIVAHAIDLRKAALPEYAEDLEAAIEDVADGVLSGHGPNRRSHLGRVRFRERLAAACGRCGGCALTRGYAG